MFFSMACFSVSSSFEKNENMVPSLLPRRLANSSFCSCCCGVIRHALYSRRLSKKLSLLSIFRKDHIRDLNFAKQSFVIAVINVDPPTQCHKSKLMFVILPHCSHPRSVAQHIKMYLNNVLLKMGQGPYVFIIFPTTCHHVFASR